MVISRAAAIMARIDKSENLRQRQFVTLPLSGPIASSFKLDSGGATDSGRPFGLADLVSSIGCTGVQQPVIVEQTYTGARAVSRLVLGERRLRACRRGLSERPENRFFATLPALICPGPLSDKDIRACQSIQDLVRKPLHPGEMAEILLLERCSMLKSRLRGLGIGVRPETMTCDPVDQWTQLRRLRPEDGRQTNLGAPWDEVIRRLGLRMTARKARLLVAVFRTIPRDINKEMDDLGITLSARSQYAQLYRNNPDAAAYMWCRLRTEGAPPQRFPPTQTHIAI